MPGTSNAVSSLISDIEKEVSTNVFNESMLVILNMPPFGNWKIYTDSFPVEFPALKKDSAPAPRSSAVHLLFKWINADLSALENSFISANKSSAVVVSFCFVSSCFVWFWFVSDDLSPQPCNIAIDNSNIRQNA